MNPASLQQSVRARARDFYLAELRAARAIDDAEIERKCAALLSRLLEAGADDDRLTVSDSSPESQAIRQVFPSGLPQLQAVHQFVRTSGQYVPPIPSGIVGESAALQRVIETASCVARSRIPVLVTGETGVGKELLARLVHVWSDRAEGPFVPVNCGALSESLTESELFGYEPNSFTGADPRGREGRIQAANHGTLLLDEVGELPAAAQVKLLRFLDRGEVQKIGRTHPEHSNARVICATHQDLTRAAAEGRFRKDLYYRIALVDLRVPPLRERLSDLPLLVDHFLECFREEYSRLQPTSIAPDALTVLQCRDWPGNVRELRFVLERAFIHCHDQEIRVEHLPPAPELSPETDGPSHERIVSRLHDARPALFADPVLWARFLIRFGGDPITNRSVVAEFRISEASARIRLSTLVDLGILEARGQKKGRKYYVLPPFSA